MFVNSDLSDLLRLFNDNGIVSVAMLKRLEHPSQPRRPDVYGGC